MGSNLRRSRGYSYESDTVHNFNKVPGWQARRLGGSSTGLPDIVATNNSDSLIFAIECKSATGNEIYVPKDEVERCHKILEMFGVYQHKRVILAFKFMSKDKKGNYRQLMEYYYDTTELPPAEMKCTYAGLLSSRTNGETYEPCGLIFQQVMPWVKPRIAA